MLRKYLPIYKMGKYLHNMCKYLPILCISPHICTFCVIQCKSFTKSYTPEVETLVQRFAAHNCVHVATFTKQRRSLTFPSSAQCSGYIHIYDGYMMWFH